MTAALPPCKTHCACPGPSAACWTETEFPARAASAAAAPPLYPQRRAPTASVPAASAGARGGRWPRRPVRHRASGVTPLAPPPAPARGRPSPTPGAGASGAAAAACWGPAGAGRAGAGMADAEAALRRCRPGGAVLSAVHAGAQARGGGPRRRGGAVRGGGLVLCTVYAGSGPGGAELLSPLGVCPGGGGSSTFRCTCGLRPVGGGPGVAEVPSGGRSTFRCTCGLRPVGGGRASPEPLSGAQYFALYMQARARGGSGRRGAAVRGGGGSSTFRCTWGLGPGGAAPCEPSTLYRATMHRI